MSSNADFEKILLDLVNSCAGNVDQFISTVQKHFANIPTAERGHILLSVASDLCVRSFFSLAIATCDAALAAFKGTQDVSGEAQCYTIKGSALFYMGNPDDAIPLHRRALELIMPLHDPRIESMCRINLGAAYVGAGDLAHAVDEYTQALSMKKELRDKAGEALCCSNLGAAYLSLDRDADACRYLEDALRLSSESSVMASESDCYINLAIAKERLGDKDRALECMRTALRLCEERHDRLRTARCCANLAAIMATQGDVREVVRYSERGAILASEIGNHSLEVHCRLQIAHAWQAAGSFPEALRSYQSAIDLLQVTNDKARLARTEVELAMMLILCDKKPIASQYLARAGASLAELHDHRAAALAFSSLARLSSDDSDTALATTSYRKALRHYQESGDWHQASETAQALIALLLDGRHAAILRDIVDLVRDFTKSCPDHNVLANAYLRLGQAYFSLDDQARSTECIGSALTLLSPHDESASVFECLKLMGLNYQKSGDYSDALEWHQKALEVSREAGTAVHEVESYVNLGTTHQQIGDPGRALQFYEQAMATGLVEANPQVEIQCLRNLVSACAELKDYEKTLRYAEMAKQALRRSGDNVSSAGCLLAAGRAVRSLGDNPGALACFTEAIADATKAKTDDLLSICNLELGVTAYASGGLREARQPLLSALGYYWRTDRCHDKSRLCSLLSDVLRRLGDHEEGMLWCRRALESATIDGDMADQVQACLDLGGHLVRMGHEREAEEWYTKGLGIAEKAGDHAKIARCLTNLSAIRIEEGAWPKAVELNEKALKMCCTVGKTATVVSCLIHLGLAFKGLGRLKDAVEQFCAALETATQCSSDRDQADCCLDLANTYLDMAKTAPALEYAERATKIARLIADPWRLATCLISLGRVHAAAGRETETVQVFEEALTTSRGVRARKLEAISHLALADILGRHGKPRTALAHALLATRRLRTLRDPRRLMPAYMAAARGSRHVEPLARCLRRYEKALLLSDCPALRDEHCGLLQEIGCMLRDEAQYAQAIDFHERAARDADAIGSLCQKEDAFAALGIDAFYAGDFKKAIDHCEAALRLNKIIGKKADRSFILITLGNAYDRLGETRRAMEYHLTAAQLAKEAGHKGAAGLAYLNLATDDLRMGDLENAFLHAEVARRDLDGQGMEAYRGSVFLLLSELHLVRGNHREALSLGLKALEDSKTTKDKYLEMHARLIVGVAHLRLGASGEGRRYLDEILSGPAEDSDPSIRYKAFAHLADDEQKMGNKKMALEMIEKAVRLAQKAGDSVLVRDGYERMGKIYWLDLQDPRRSYECLSRALMLGRETASSLQLERHRLLHSYQMLPAYWYAVPVCLQLDKQEEAFSYMEESKSTLLPLIAASFPPPHVVPEHPLASLYAQERQCLARLKELQMLHLSANRRWAKLGEIEALGRELNDVYEKIAITNPQYVSLRKGDSVKSREVLHLLQQQPVPINLVEYFIGMECVYVFLFDGVKGGMQVHTNACGEEDLMRLASVYHESVTSGKDDGPAREAAAQLSRILLTSIQSSLSPGRRVCFVPHRVLHYLPLHALPIGGEPLILKTPVVYSPSSSVLRFIWTGRRPIKGRAASIGYEFEHEARMVADILACHPCVGNGATKNAVVKALEECDIVHISCHGRFDTQNPLSSGLKLSDGLLTARDIFGLRTKASLVTLSACETGVGKLAGADELLGLTRAFLYSGASSLVLSQWSVNALSTLFLMTRFYGHIKEGMDKATALQQAQIDTMRQAKWSNPFYWAGFFLLGNWL